MSTFNAGSPYSRKQGEEVVSWRGPAPAPLTSGRRSTPPLVSPRGPQAQFSVESDVLVQDETGVVWQSPAVTLNLDRTTNTNMVIEIDQGDDEDVRNETIMRRLFGEVRLGFQDKTTGLAAS